MVEPEILERCIQPVDAPRCLLHDLIGVVLAIKNNGICFDTVPTFCSSVVLYKIDPFIRIRYRLMLVPIPLSHLHTVVIGQMQENIQLIVEVIENDNSGVSCKYQALLVAGIHLH